VATRLVLDELDLDLSTLTATLLIVVVIIIARHRSPRTLGATGVGAVTSEIITGRWMVKTSVGIKLIGHDECVLIKDALLDSL
jgi:hypothetical protein